jgi:hypothetical protein
MTNQTQARSALRRWGRATRAWMVAGGLGLTLGVGAVMPAMPQQIVVIGDDRGGLVGARAELIDRLRAVAARVEIRGNVCYSACTMYLGAGDVCVSPTTVFGFHGPTRNGQTLAPESFDHWTGVMARHYSTPLRTWFMTIARYEQSGVMELPGTELIRIGYAAC